MQKRVLLIGAGITSGVIANKLSEFDINCTVVDKRDHIGGNCHTINTHGITVHEYGVHIFHTDSDLVFVYIAGLTDINHVKYRVLSKVNDHLYSFPINLLTINQLFGITDPIKANEIINKQVTREKLFDLFYSGYTMKQWGLNINQIDHSIIDRIPIRNTYNDTYFIDDKYEFVPDYNLLFDNLFSKSEIILNSDVKYKDLPNDYDVVVLTGSLDSFFGYPYGELPYRSLIFKHNIIKADYVQGAHVIHHPSMNVSYTRTIEHKLLLNEKSDYTIFTEEYPTNDPDNPYYPINNNNSKRLWIKYAILAKNSKIEIIPAGRLGLFEYIDMDQAVLSGITTSWHILAKLGITKKDYSKHTT